MQKKNVIIVLNYNDFETTKEYVEKIQFFNILDQVIVVDNCSPDGSYDRLKKISFSSKVEIIKTNKNDGYGKGNNFGMKYAEKKYNPDYFIISNPDIIVFENTIENIIDFLKKNDDVSAATGLVHDLKGNVAKNFAWKQPRYLDILLDSTFILKVIFEIFLKYSNRYLITNIKKPHMNVDILSGCFFIVKSDLIKNVNYFNEKTFLYHEENLLFGKLNENYQQYVLTDEKIIHYQGTSTSKNLNKWNNKINFMNESANIYLKDYLNVGNFSSGIYNKLSNIFKYERYASLLIKQNISSFLKSVKEKKNE
ncbi:glycosyltransferase [Exiguobacterium sp. s80]|uniref:glycosyltransferase n=1 Tax=Exiguobacterium sp. s80 TaxID=2751209 RepID=UPI001BEACD70|nr:glycosyltransferase family 2 protein [Exiguobacterium sp. s80]